ncbi:MAG TPA: 5'-methylthioadenosine/S-adenosylhomocysteine nucleosidase [Anaerolineales bacterium]|nr:5'-methylthioadenosine/S-adenosylhomocysteine nucleosidase [Anaerolineales bacterium]
MKPLVIVSAVGEWRMVKELFPGGQVEQSPFGELLNLKLGPWDLMLFQGGWGKISAAATAQYVIDRFKPDLLINLGTCGGFEGRIENGTIILVERTIVYDILEQMTDAAGAIAHYSTELDLSWLPRVLPFPVLRGLLISGDRDIVAEDIPMLVKKYGAVAADWESGAIAWVAQRNGIRLLILRGVSDLVGASGGEAYGDYELFKQRTKEIMKRLFEELPKWLGAVESIEQGYRGY